MQCKNCQQNFTITDEDKKFYVKINVPEPKFCPACRRRQLLCWRNERTLYSRQCDKTGKNIISVFAPGSGYTVYDRDYWWSDGWDPCAYGREFDFSRTFNEQFDELIHRVPMVGIFNAKSVNSQYCNHVGEMKNCHLLFASWEVEDSLYGDMLIDVRDSVDALECNKLEKCYELVSSADCYNVKYSLQAENCLDSCFLFDCRACSNCVACTNLRNKQYYIFNQPYSKDEYEKKVQAMKLHTRSGVEKIKNQFLELKLKAIHRFAFLIKCQNSTGDNLSAARDCYSCFGVRDAQACSYCINGVPYLKDTYDGYGVGVNAERGYFILDTGDHGMDNFFCGVVWGSAYTYYCYNCHSSTELFGCTGLRHKKHCILNKQYSEAEYFKLKEKIIEYLKQTGEWGQFFSPAISPFGLNETIAQNYNPLSRTEAIAQGFKWQDNLPGTFGQETVKPENIPDDIEAVGDDILGQILACANCQKNFKIIKQELDFYREMAIPLPLHCPDCRYQFRLKQRNPHHLWHRQCLCDNIEHGHGQRCPVEFETPYVPDRPEKVYCEECYQKEIY